MFGQLVYTSSEITSTPDIKKEFDVAALAKGVYFLEAILENDKITRQLIKD